jgi:hypothetical protein
VDSDDEDEEGLHEDEDRKDKGKDKDKGKEAADDDLTTGCETPAVSLAGATKRASSSFAAPAAKRSSNFLFSGQSSSKT